MQTIFGVSSADTSAQVLEVGARRDRIFKALVIDAVELAGIAANVSSRATAECLVGLTQVLVGAFFSGRAAKETEAESHEQTRLSIRIVGS